MSDGSSSSSRSDSLLGDPAASLRVCIEGGPQTQTLTFDSLRELIVGRDASCQVRIPHDSVSRQHMRLFHRDGRWFAEDLDSRNGTMVDGVMLAPRRPFPVGTSSTILVRPFALRVDAGVVADDSRGAAPLLEEREESGFIRPLVAEELGAINGRRLALLLQAADAINAAQSERDVADAATEALIAGTGFARAVMLRWSGTLESRETLAVRIGEDADAVPSAGMSRTLLRAAAAGAPAQIDDLSAIREAESIAGSGVAAALCVPVFVPPVVEAFLYLDSQRRSARPNPDAAAFCQVLAKLCGLAIGNLRRMAAEDRQRQLEQQLMAARHAQSRLLPDEHGEHDGCRWRLFVRPGSLVAGAIACIHRGRDGTTFLVGDVRGKGVEAAIVMTMVASHLPACLAEGLGLAEAVSRTGAFIHRHRRDEADFVSLFAVQIDRRAGVVRTVDAGHGLALRIRDGEAAELRSEGGTVLGIESDPRYQASEFPCDAGSRLLLFTDGVVEQCGTEGRGQFGLGAVVAAVAGSPSPEVTVERIRAALRAHAGGDEYSDDVTILCVETP